VIKNIFRKEAVKQLQSFSSLNEPVRFIRPQMWFALAGFVILASSILAWAFLGRIPAMVEGYGVFYLKGHISEIVSEKSGILQDIFVRDGQAVQKGQLLAYLKLMPENALASNEVQNYEIKAPYDGIVLEISMYPVANVKAGDLVMLLSPMGINKRDLQGVAFVSAIEGKKIKKGMKAAMEVSTVQVESHGRMLGEVSEVAILPASWQEVLSIVKVNQVAKLIEKKIPVVPLYVSILPETTNLSTMNGYKWTLKEPEHEIELGTFFNVHITISEVKPITYVLPYE